MEQLANLSIPGCVSDVTPSKTPRSYHDLIIRTCFFLLENLQWVSVITILYTLSTWQLSLPGTPTHTHLCTFPSSPRFVSRASTPRVPGRPASQSGFAAQLVCLESSWKHCLNPVETPEHVFMVHSFLPPCQVSNLVVALPIHSVHPSVSPAVT